jgi:hypothetical protein
MPVPFGSLVDVEPTVLLASEDAPSSVLPLFEDVLLELVSAGLLSRTILVLTSQHSLEAVPLDPEPVPVPCAVAVSAAAKRAAPVITARQTLPIMFPPSLNPNKSQCGLSNSVPLDSHSPARAMFFGSPALRGESSQVRTQAHQGARARAYHWVQPDQPAASDWRRLLPSLSHFRSPKKVAGSPAELHRKLPFREPNLPAVIAPNQTT